MLFGRPINLVVGAISAIINVVVLVLAALVPPIVIPAVIVSGVNVAAFAVIALIANAPPVLAPGDTFKVQTPAGQPNYETTVAHPPASDPPPVPKPEDGKP
jgi:hypothetical protein